MLASVLQAASEHATGEFTEKKIFPRWRVHLICVRWYNTWPAWKNVQSSINGVYDKKHKMTTQLIKTEFRQPQYTEY